MILLGTVTGITITLAIIFFLMFVKEKKERKCWQKMERDNFGQYLIARGKIMTLDKKLKQAQINASKQRGKLLKLAERNVYVNDAKTGKIRKLSKNEILGK